MIIDALLKVMTAQAFTAVAVSTNSIDLGAAAGLGSPSTRQIGTGEPMGFGFSTDVAASATTVLMEIISAADAALASSVTVVAARTVTAAQAALGAMFFLGIPPGTPIQRYIGVRVTPAGGAATVTMSAWLTAQSLFSLLPNPYGKNYVV